MSTPPTAGPHAPAGHHPTHFWLWVMCLTGVDYFSTLGYQPSIAFENAGLLAPLATVVLVAVTLFGALPVYRYVAKSSPHGQGSIGMLAKLVTGWPGKIMVLVLLGFAATDYVITKTLSAADAAEHLIHNPFWPFPTDEQRLEDRWRLAATFFLLVLLGATFLRGFREVIGLAVGIVGAYLVLNAVVLGSGLLYLAEHPAVMRAWLDRLAAGEWHIHHPPVSGTGVGSMVLVSLILFPSLALGLSGFETGVAVMPLVRGDPGDTEADPKGRVRNARKLLVTAAVIMSVMLLASSLVTAALVPADAMLGQPGADKKPPAKDRALAYLAHAEGPHAISPVMGDAFGTAYDIGTIVILWFAGASAMAGLLNLVPRYLPRYGMAPEWARAMRPLVVLFTAINLLVTYLFNADVSAQGAAYATGVLVLMTSAGVAAVIELWRRREGPWWRRLSWRYGLITAVFVYTTADIVYEKPDGLKIAAWFIAAILVTSIVSRVMRSRELRFEGFHIPEETSKFLWDSIRSLELPVLVPHRPGQRSLLDKEAAIRRDHRLPPEMDILFIEVDLADPSEFVNKPTLQVIQEQGRYIMKVTNASSIAHTLAAVGIELAKVGKPPEIHFGWTNESPLSGTLGFLLFGEGNVPWLVRELIRKAEPDPARRPQVIIAGP